MKCSVCANENREGSRFCGVCGTNLLQTENLTKPKTPEISNGYVHASFGRRATAYMIDWFLIASFTVLFLALIGFTREYKIFFSGFESYSRLTSSVEYSAVILLSSWLYFSLMESLNSATLGKLILGLRVIEKDGCMLTFGKATVRFLAKTLSGLILCLGYIMALLDKDKYTMHDKMTSTLVIEVEH